jgi:hypothetical protein
MFALVLSATAFEVEVEFGGAPGQLFVVDEPVSQEAVFPGLSGLFGMVEQLQQEQMQQMQQMRRPTPTHPCENDQMRFRCVGESATVACLKNHKEQLSPSCSSYLLAAAEPVPSPSPEAGGTFATMYTDQNGVLRTATGSMNSREGRKVVGELEQMMEEFMPEIFAGFFDEPKRQQTRQVAVPAPTVRKPTNAHPCEKEVNQCKAELNDVTARGPIQECLISHYSQLSSDCKCFLHQVMGGELEKVVPAAKSTTAPRMRTVATLQGRAVPLFEEEPVRKPSHKLTCALFMSMFVISLWLVLYRVCHCCCAPKPKFAAVVPPTQPVKMSVEPLVAPVVAPKP